MKGGFDRVIQRSMYLFPKVFQRAMGHDAPNSVPGNSGCPQMSSDERPHAEYSLQQDLRTTCRRIMLQSILV
jgi:hypothetical protein